MMDSDISEKPIRSNSYYRNWIGLFFFGTINNIFYVIVNSSAQDVCEYFDADGLIGAVLWCNIFFGLICRSMCLIISFVIYYVFSYKCFFLGKDFSYHSFCCNGCFYTSWTWNYDFQYSLC